MHKNMTQDIVFADPLDRELTTAAAIALSPIWIKPINAEAMPIFSFTEVSERAPEFGLNIPSRNMNAAMQHTVTTSPAREKRFNNTNPRAIARIAIPVSSAIAAVDHLRSAYRFTWLPMIRQNAQKLNVRPNWNSESPWIFIKRIGELVM